MARSTLLRRLRRFAVGFFCLLIAAALVGAIYQVVATCLDATRYAPSGKLIDIGGRRLHLYCTGSGSATVILEAGLGGGVLDWPTVQPDLARDSRVCSYDRAGIGWSDRGDGARDANSITTDLHALLVAADIRTPYVLVGQSIGGAYVQLFAARYPNEVSGVILVDSSHADQLSRYTAIPSGVPYAFKIAAPIGVARIVNSVTQDLPNLPPDRLSERIALSSRTAAVFSTADEMIAIPDTMAELRAAPMHLGVKPLIVISRGLSDGGSPDEESVWRQLQTELPSLSGNSKHIVAERSGHYIQFFEPDVVIDAIRQVIDETNK